MGTRPGMVGYWIVFPQQHILQIAMLRTALPKIERAVFGYPLSWNSTKAERTQAGGLRRDIRHALQLFSF
jgi:hypothetical protein